MRPSFPPPVRQEQVILDQLRTIYSKKLSPKALTALQAFQRGVRAYAQGQYAQTRAELSQPAIAQETALGDYALFYLAASQVENPSAGKKVLEKLLRQHPDSTLVVPAKVELAWIEKEAGRWSAAALILNEPSVLENNTFAMALLAECHERLDNTAAVRELYEKIYYEFPTSKEAGLAAAKRAAWATPDREAAVERELQRVDGLIKGWQYRDALDALQKLALRNPPPPALDRIHLQQGICYYHLKKYPSAMESLRRVSAKRPDDHAQALYYEFLCQRRLGSAGDPEAALEKLQERYPLHKHTEAALFLQAGAYEVQKAPDQAAKIYRQLVERFAEGVYCERALWKTVWLDYSEGRYERAARGCLDYLRRFPDGPNNFAALYWAGRSYEKRKSPEVAALLYWALRARTSNWYGLQAEKQLHKLGQNVAGRETPVPPEIAEALGRIRLNDPAVALEPARLSPHLEKVRQLHASQLDNLALKELEVIGGQPPARTDFLKVEMSRERVDYLRWMRAFSKILPNYYQYHQDELPIEVWKILFPIENWVKIKAEAAKYNLDPYLMCALIRQESAYDPKALSSAHAMGLTQILPSTGRQIARSLGYKKFTANRLYDPAINIQFGAYFFANLLKRYGGSVESALAAYNGGPSRMDAWSQQFGREDISQMVESIPLSETRNYVKKIVAMRERYRQIYER